MEKDNGVHITGAIKHVAQYHTPRWPFGWFDVEKKMENRGVSNISGPFSYRNRRSIIWLFLVESSIFKSGTGYCYQGV